MNKRIPQCPHLGNHHATALDIKKLSKQSCAKCKHTGANLWVCLQRDCLEIGCSEQLHDHSGLHFRTHQSHCVHLNMSSQRAWCYLCEREVFLSGVEQSAQIDDPFTTFRMRLGRNGNGNNNNNNNNTNQHAFDEDDNFDADGKDLVMDSHHHHTRMGLVGLHNIANTCYMNAALQALSNVLPMTHYFLNCGDLVQHAINQASHRSKAGLAKSYQSLMYDMWCRRTTDSIKKGLTPRGILYGIRSVHSMFRGCQQHDTQEFLRCFMDQLHEELKELRPTIMVAMRDSLQEMDSESSDDDDDDDDDCEASSACSSLSRSSSFTSNQSNSEYETCDSGDEEPLTMTARQIPIEPQNPHQQKKQKQQQQQNSKRHSTLSAQSPSSSSAQTQLCSVIGDIFDGKLLSSVQCLTCDRISTREETFQDLSLPIPNRDYLNLLHSHSQTHVGISVQHILSASIDSMSLRSNNTAEGWLAWAWNWFSAWFWGPSITLHDCMASFFSADELKGDNMYSCEKCNKLRTGVKYSQIMHLPEVLCIHLKRFRHDILFSSKISSHVHFPLEGFDMKPYLHKDCVSHVSTYNLVSVICHHGTVGGGHYTCYARNSQTNRWYEYDDELVREVSSETVQNCQAYVLFYGKHNPSMEMIRAEASDLAATYPAKEADIRFYVARDWLARFNSFADPGPITNWAILCPHGGILQSKIGLLNQIAVPIAQPLWEFLHRKLGGGPAINMLFECEICKREAEALAHRQYNELSIFTKYNVMDATLDATAIYAISMTWLRRWQQFVRGQTNKEPGPINNASIAAVATTSPSQHSMDSNRTTAAAVLRPGRSDYAQICAPLWRFLYGRYGGGPEIMLRGPINGEIEIIDQDEYDVGVDEEEEEKNIPNNRHFGDISDTESNMGDQNHHTLSPAARDSIHEELNGEHEVQTNGISINKTINNVHEDEQNQQQQHEQINAPSSYPWSNSSTRDTKHGRHLLGNTNKKLKVAAVLRSSLRRRGIRGRHHNNNNSMKRVDFFGPMGTYIQENCRIDGNAMPTINDTLFENGPVAAVDGVVGPTIDGKHSKQSFPSDSQSSSRSNQSSNHSERNSKTKGRSNNHKRNIPAEAFAKVNANEVHGKEGRLRHHHHNKSKAYNNKASASIKLQKFTYLDGETKSTDAGTFAGDGSGDINESNT